MSCLLPTIIPWHVLAFPSRSTPTNSFYWCECEWILYWVCKAESEFPDTGTCSVLYPLSPFQPSTIFLSSARFVLGWKQRREYTLVSLSNYAWNAVMWDTRYEIRYDPVYIYRPPATNPFLRYFSCQRQLQIQAQIWSNSHGAIFSLVSNMVQNEVTQGL